MWTSWARRLRDRFRMQRPPAELTPAQAHILIALVQGAHLKAHRTADGAKDYRLHRADGSVIQTVAGADVHHLRAANLLVGNMKFPAATYLLTPAGLQHAHDLAAQERGQDRAQKRMPAHRTHPLTPRG